MILDQDDNEKLVMNKEYQEVFDASIEKMLQNSNAQDEEGLEPSE
jgi:hypothetical protein